MSEFLLLEYATTSSISEPLQPFSGGVSYFVKYNFLVLKIENIYIENNELKFGGNIEEMPYEDLVAIWNETIGGTADGW